MPYISKVTGVNMVDIATKIILGAKLKDMGYKSGLYPAGDYIAVKVPVFSFEKLNDVDNQLGPEMKSTGRVPRYRKDLQRGSAQGTHRGGL